MGNIGKVALTPDTQLTSTCFLKKRFLVVDLYIMDRREYKTPWQDRIKPLMIE